MAKPTKKNVDKKSPAEKVQNSSCDL